MQTVREIMSGTGSFTGRGCSETDSGQRRMERRYGFCRAGGERYPSGSVRADRKSERACCKDQSSGVCGADRRGQAKEQAQTLLEYGVDKVYVYAHEALAHFRGDVYTNIMEDCIKTVKPTVVLVGATSLGRSLAPACATRFRTGLTADCTVLDMKENTDLVQIRPAFGGNIMAQIITTNTRPQFATVRYKVMNVAEKTEPNGEVVTCEVTDEMLESGMEVISTEIVEKIKGIEEEDVLVVAGRGVKKQEDLGLLQELADALGGQLATTRPLVEKGWNDVTKQIGLSGRTVKPKLIITCGVSGAVQFAAGMDGAECIVAINTDAEAPIFKIANYCITEDLYRVVPALTAAVREKQQ